MKLLTIKGYGNTVKCIAYDATVQTFLEQREMFDVKLVKQRRGLEVFKYTNYNGDKFTITIESVNLLKEVDVYSIETEVKFPMLYTAE